MAKRAALNDREAQDTIWRQHSDKIRALVSRHLRGHHRADIDDVVQEVSIRLWPALRKWRGDCALSSWIYYVVRSGALMYLRKAKAQSAYETEPFEYLSDEKNQEEFARHLVHEDRTVERLEARQQLGRCAGAIARTRALFREPFRLHVIHELSNPEIAAIMRVSVPTVKARVHRARLSIAHRLAANG